MRTSESSRIRAIHEFLTGEMNLSDAQIVYVPVRRHVRRRPHQRVVQINVLPAPGGKDAKQGPGKEDDEGEKDESESTKS